MINFVNVEEKVKTLNQQFIDNEFSEKELEEQLLALIDQADDGYYWMFGHQTQHWYRHDGKRWIVDKPNAALELYIDGDEGEQQIDWNEIFLGIIFIVFLGMIIYLNTG